MENVMSMYKSRVTIDGQNKVVLAVYHKDESEGPVVESTVVNRLHHIHVVDRSGSVSGVIHDLIDNLQESIREMGDEDIVTVIWFSGNGQFRTVVKGASKSDAIIKLLDSLRSTVGCTCFSQSLEEVNLILDEIGELAPVSVTLWTDGQPVVPWSVEEEENRSIAHIAKMKDRILALNTIGYGNYYNADLLRRFAAMTEFGEFVHSAKIADYMSIFNHNFQKVSDAVCEKVQIETDGAGIIYLNRTFTKMATGTEFHLSRIDKRKNQFFLFADDDFKFTYNGVEYDTATCPVKAQMNSAQMLNFFYAYAYNLYYAGNRAESLKILAENIHDKALIDSHMRSFTFDESGRHLDKLNKALMFPQDHRFIDGTAPVDYLPADDAFCVLDVLNYLAEGTSLYVPFSKNLPGYNRIGKKATDQYDLFVWTTDEVRCPMGDLVYNKEHMNMSIRLRIPGTVRINPKDAKPVGLPTVMDSYIWRNHTIIKDGALNLKQIEVLLSPEDFMSPLVNSAIAQMIEHVDVEDKTYSRCILDFTELPIVSRKYINAALGIDRIFNLTVQVTRLEARQKAINFYADGICKTLAAPAGEYKNFSPEAVEVLERHGIAKDLSYKGVDVVKPKAEDCDSYQSRTMEFVLSGFSSWSKISEVLERTEKILKEEKDGKVKTKLTPNQLLLKEALDTLHFELSGLKAGDADFCDKVRELQALTKKQLLEIRNELNVLKIAKLLTGDWFPELQTDDKGAYFYEKDGTKMVAKTAYTTEYF